MIKILIIDDDFVNRQFMSSILDGYAKCDVASSGKEAIEAYNLSITTNSRYNVLLLDIKMPDMDGISFLKVLRKHEEKAGILLGKGVPVVMVTGHEDMCIDAFSAGCDGYITKPVNVEQLKNTINKLLE